MSSPRDIADLFDASAQDVSIRSQQERPLIFDGKSSSMFCIGNDSDAMVK